jgi:hypothetical protein
MGTIDFLIEIGASLIDHVATKREFSIDVFCLSNKSMDSRSEIHTMPFFAVLNASVE